MWGITLSGPLDIVAMVSRYLTIKLMSRMPIFNRRSFKNKRCRLFYYGVLIQISLSYPPVKGRLHTRYSPVRRSSALDCSRLLPLDLHVLSLPLAFILSQDQTLHCLKILSTLKIFTLSFFLP